MARPNEGPLPKYYYPNKMARAYLMGLEEVLGRNGLNAVLNFAKLRHLVDRMPPNNLNKEFSFEEFAAIQEALEEMYGPRGGKGLALRAGRATFKYGLREFGAVLGMADLALRVLPLSVKLRVGLNAFAETFNRFSDQIVRLEEDDQRFIWVNERCPVCWGRHTDAPCCHAAVGILEEGLRWGSGGKTFKVEEITCIAVGDDACRFVIPKTPTE
ncbi:MAG: 4-vinyl reductase [Chloroflexi bacterium]|nr:MAG: 4-vinyl reductase [Chloroflexota bacterium]HDN79841.1 4-vinyl reductase [Chloroflexota bacterium]